MRHIKSVLFTILFLNLLFTGYTQELTYGILNQDLIFLQDQKTTLEPNDPFPDALTIPDSVLVKKGTFIFIDTKEGETQINQTLYVINSHQELKTTITLSKTDPIAEQSQYYKPQDEIPKSYLKTNISKSINVFGVYSPKSPNVSYICTSENNQNLFWHQSKASSIFLNTLIYNPLQKVFIYENESLQSTGQIKSNTSPDCINGLILDTSNIGVNISNYGLVSFHKINTKKNHTPDYQTLLSRVKKFENNSGSDSSIRISFVGALDLNNDRVNELIFEITSYESHNYMIYEFQSEWKLIYTGGGCSY